MEEQQNNSSQRASRYEGGVNVLYYWRLVIAIAIIALFLVGKDYWKKHIDPSPISQKVSCVPADFAASSETSFIPSALSFEEYNIESDKYKHLRYVGIKTIDPELDSKTGPRFEACWQGFPNMMIDRVKNNFYLHPGTFESAKSGALVSANISTAGTYQISGAFARANVYQAGDGVRVVIFVNDKISTPLVDKVLSQTNKVDLDDLFAGTGVVPFNLTTTLSAGDVLRFAVLSGPSLKDGTFDLSALKFSIKGEGMNMTFPSESEANKE